MITLLQAHFRSRADRTALRDADGKRVTYGELDLHIRRIAARLTASGFQKGDKAILTASRGIGYAEALLGVLAAGGAYIPLSDHYPAERTEWIRQDSGAAVVIDDAFLAEAADTAPADAPLPVSGQDPALVLYTSGSAGQPKGILHDHSSLRASVERTIRAIGMSPDDVIAVNAPHYFVAHIADLLCCLACGAEGFIVPDELRADPDGLSVLFAENGITTAFIPPKVLRFFKKKGGNLKTVFTAGERLSQVRPDGFRLLNFYGMTETAGLATFFEADRSYDNTPIGKPAEGICVYLLDENGRCAGEGEICIAGNLGRSYLNQPEKSAEVFTPNPFAAQDGFPVLIRTGDLGKRLPDGNLVYRNRKDWMIKINGQRVEPGEIEAKIRMISGIREAAVKDFTDGRGQVFLTAYYAADAPLDEDTLRNALSASLPDYMLPAFFVHLAKMPVNANGKLDRNALPKPGTDRRRAAYAAPENDTEQQICNAFSKVLDIPDIGLDDNFFALGGDSIKVMMLQKALREAGIERSAKAILASRTPRMLSCAEAQSSALSGFCGAPASAYPLTHAQMSIYLDCHSKNMGIAYHNAFGLFLPAGMHASAEQLCHAASTVLSGYPVLNTKVQLIEGMPSLVLCTGQSPAVPCVRTDVTDHAKLAASVNTPFDLENGPLYRAQVFENREGLLLVCVLHHIVCDGTSVSLLAQNIAAAFDGRTLLHEEMNNLVLSQYEAAHAGQSEEDAAVYRRMLDEMDSDTELYADDDPALKQFAGKLGIYETTIPQDMLSGSLTAKLSDAQLTESTLFMSAYAYLLRLLCNQKGVLFFAGENGRHDPVLQNTVGMLVHNIPVFTSIDETADCTAFMTHLQEQFHALTVCDSADLAGLCGEYGIHADYFFVYQGEMLSGAEIGGRYLPMELYHSDGVMASLTLHVLKQRSGAYTLRFEYAAEKFKENTVSRFASLYSRIIEGLCTAKTLCQIPLVSGEDTAEMDACNDTGAAYPVSDIVSLFREQVRKHPDKTAVIFREEMLTYAQTDDISERIAWKIRSLGIGRGDVVSILIPRCSCMTTASLGVLKSGAAYQPLDPSYPTERLTFMMQDAGSKLLIAEEALLSRVPDYNGEVLLTKDIPSLPGGGVIAETPDPSDLLILLYTSGSTGTPKGVMLEHRNLANFCAWYREYYHLDENSRVAAYASYGFDANMMDQYPALTTGACVCIMEEEIRLDLLAMEEWINRLGITHSFMTTQVGRQFYSMTSPEKLKYLSTGGEKLVPLPPKEGEPAFFNVYGPTECTILTTCQRVERLYDRVPIGRPIGNYKCYVMDEYGRRLPPLVPGELLIAGRGVGRGYLNRPDLTEKVFIRNPFCQEEGAERAYRSGDIVRLLPDGTIDFIGRNDGQVKVRGFRIELTEVEGVIREFPGIKDATVQAFEDAASGEKYIAAYVVSDEIVDISAMQEFILQRKPPYMVPAVTMQLERIPLNQNQKVNKKELPKPVRQKAETIPPQTEMQQKIFDCVAEVIGHTDFGITTNIYEAGLSSIGAIRLNVLLAKAFGAAVSSHDLKENNTVDKLETFLRSSGQAETFAVQTDYGLTKTQEGVYVESVARPEDTLYNIPILLEISGEIDTQKLKGAIAAAVHAHPLLKTRLFLNDSGDVRMRRMDGDMSFDESAVTERNIGEIEEEKKTLCRPFRLLGGRLFRTEILHGEKTWLFIEMHHIIADGSSIAIFLNDISAAYAGETLTPETYSGFEAVLNEEQLRKGEAYQKAKQYYETLLNGAETQSLPAGDAAESTGPAPAVYEYTAEDFTAEESEAWCRENRASMNGLFSAAFGLTLNKYLGTESVAFTGIYSGRNDSRLAGTVAMLVKTLPIVSTLRMGMTAAEYVREMSSQLVSSQSHDIYSFAEISRSLHVNADVMFAWQGNEFTFDTLCGKPARLIPLALSEAKAPMNLNVFIDDGRLRFSMEYRKDRFSEDYIRCFLLALEKAVSGLLHSKWLAEVSLMYREARQMLDSFNATDVTIPYTTCNRLFEAQAERHPDKTAVIAGGEQLTYAQLNESANRIANALIEQGTRPDHMVGVMMPREVWAYAVREGVLKAGGAYMPLAPDYPDDRVEYIITNSGSKTLITNQAIAGQREALFSRLGITVCTVEALLQYENTENPDPGVTPENLCYCIYTSGSTGKPKGVMIEHHSLVNFVDHNPVNLQSCEFADNMTVSLALAALTFDVSVLEETLGLYHGGTVAMATEEEINNPLLLCDMMRRHGVDVMKCTPSYMNNLLDFRETWDVLRQMKAIDIGAEAFPAPLYDKMRAAGITAKIHNGYGPTETTITASMDHLTDHHITIGKPLCNTQIVMLDKFGNELPPDVPGELTIVGECVGRGYVANEKLTAEKFITWRETPAYRSGDMARWGRNGKIHFIGRADNQVKLRGLRIELDEIENVMNTYPSVLRSVVLVRTSDKGEQYLCAWFAASETVEHSALKAHLAKSLAKYMIPSVFVQLDAIPLTQNGKVDKKALPEPGLSKTKDIRPASTRLQKQIAGMFAKALGTETVGVDEDFFEIGGTSLLASKVAMLAMVEGLPIAYQDIFACPTVEALEQHVLGKSHEPEKPAGETAPAADDLEIAAVRDVLAYNTMAHIREIRSEPVGDILLTGATGFLGIHMLRELIEHTDGKITCLVRRGNSGTARKRLETMLVYYFETNYAAEFDSGRLRAVDGDITDRELVLAQDGLSFDTVINCAACVKHFANDDILERVNVRGVENLIALCEKTGTRLVQISTVSVAGENVNHAFPETKKMFENMLYFGQDLSNQYVRSKFDAEKAVLEHIAAGTLRAKIIRVGNLMSRDSDGEFQANSVTSGFMRNLKGYAAIGAYPVNAMATPVEFSPIDLTAEAVRLLAGTPDAFTVFHAVNGHWIEMGDVVAAMNASGLPVEVLDEEEFSRKLSLAMQDEKTNMLVSGLISYLSSDAETTRSYIGDNHMFTKNALYRLGFRWALTDEQYLRRAIEALIALDFFSGDPE